jgi:phenylalanyl-tRNA synthetase beta chain
MLSLDAIGASPRRPRTASEISRYPASDVDLAFVAGDDLPAAALVAAVGRAGGDLIEDVSLFDVYRGDRLGPGRRSLALRVRIRALDRTLSDAELGEVRRRLIEAGRAVGADLRT